MAASQDDLEKTLAEAQQQQQTLQAIAMQKQAMQMQEKEIERAIEELEKAQGDVYKSVGPILIKSEKEKLKAELEETKGELAIRLKSFDSQERRLKDSLKEAEEKLKGLIRPGAAGMAAMGG